MASAVSFIQHPAGVHTPYSVVPVMNLSTSPMLNLYQYQSVPQLNHYSTFKPALSGYHQSLNYPIQPQRSSIYIPGPSSMSPQAVSVDPPMSEFHGSISNHPKPLNIRRDDHDLSQKFDHGKGSSNFSKRDGWNSGWGSGSGSSVSQSPAISALALLGFLFFLNLIQNSLQNNRQMLTTTTMITNTTTTMTNTGSSSSSSSNTVAGRSGRVRRKRGLGFEEHNVTPGSIPTHPNRQIEAFLLNRDDEDFHVRLNGRPFPERTQVPLIPGPQQPQVIKPSSNYNNPNIPNRRMRTALDHPPENSSTTSALFQRIKRASLGCIQLAACNVGRSLHSQIGPRAGLFMRMLRQSFPSSKRNRNNWTSRMAKALTYGWTTKRDCYRLFRNCFWNPQYKHQYPTQNHIRRNNHPKTRTINFLDTVLSG